MTQLDSEKRFLCKFYYIGSEKYHGSQRQLDFLTIEDCIISTLREKNYIKTSDVSIIEFASRTDRLVSARGATFSFITNKNLILMEINSALPRDIGLWTYCTVPMDFSSRYNAVMRHYKYVYPEPVDILKNLDFKLLKKACNLLKGRHDFINFCKRKNDQSTSIRDLDIASVNILNNHLVFDFKSRGFLRQQIRRMVRKLMEVGLKIITFQEFMALFDSSIERSYQPADPRGLILWDISYGENISFKPDPKSIERMENYFFNQMINHNLKAQIFSILQQDKSS